MKPQHPVTWGQRIGGMIGLAVLSSPLLIAINALSGAKDETPKTYEVVGKEGGMTYFVVDPKKKTVIHRLNEQFAVSANYREETFCANVSIQKKQGKEVYYFDDCKSFRDARGANDTEEIKAMRGYLEKTLKR